MRTTAFFLLAAAIPAAAQWGGTLHFALHSEPKNLHPHRVKDAPSETIRYLTAGTLVRLNRLTQELEPNLALSWKITDSGRLITFRLRDGVRFSDGSPFRAEDVVFSFQSLMDPGNGSPAAEPFRTSGGSPVVTALSPTLVTVRVAKPIAGLDRAFDQVAILSSRSPRNEQAVLGPFALKEYKAGSHVLLERNPNYWRKDQSGRSLPYLDAIRLDIQQNRDLELLRFRRGELDLIDRLDPDTFARLAAEMPAAARDTGPSLESEFLWFNQSPSAPLPPFKKAWFQSKEFRRAVSSAIHRADLARIVFRGYATPAAGPISPVNKLWFDSQLTPHPYDRKDALARLANDGFSLQGDGLRDRSGNPVEFSLLTNAGNKTRERLATLIQQDLAKIGVKLNIVTLDFPSLIERMTKTLNYESCLLGFVNVDLDPNGQMNVWMSSGASHQWNPSQQKPATAWEAEIDRYMTLQASSMDHAKRKAAFDQVQRIAWEQAPILYLVNKNTLVAVGPALRNVQLAGLYPQVFWNAERLYLATTAAAK